MEKIVENIFLKALEACQPSVLIKNNISVDDGVIAIDQSQWKIGDRQLVYVIAIGKASRPMTSALKAKLNIPSSNILCITPDSNSKEEYCLTSSHPVPDKKSITAGNKLIDFVASIQGGSLVLFALSGGASSLVCQPIGGISIADINRMNQLLIKSGLDIEEINIIRKHLSTIKGGQLLTYFPTDCTLIDLVISDVPDDDLETIGSGLTIPDSSTFKDVRQVLLKYDLWQKTPESIRQCIQKGVKGEVAETLKPGSDPVQNHHSFIIGSAEQFAKIIAQKAEKKGYQSWIAEEPFNQPVGKVAEMISDNVRAASRKKDQPLALIFYGESTVKVMGNGKGGRNQELALYGAIKIEGLKDVTWLSAGTDGIDGPTDAAGAIVDGTTIQDAQKAGLDPKRYLKNNDSYHFHKQMGTLLKTGPTGNNVMDIVLVIIE